MVVESGPPVAVLTDLSDFDLRPDLIRRIPRALALQYNVLPLSVEHDVLTVAVADGNDPEILERLRLATGQHVRITQAPAELIRHHLDLAFASAPVAPHYAADNPPAVTALDAIHLRAVLANASDIHFEPTRDGGRIRHRVDGMLYEGDDLHKDVFAPVVSRLKLMAGMDIADRRHPQDGRYSIDVGGRSIDARVSSMPTVAGEKLVVRLLDHRAAVPGLEALGMDPLALEAFRSALHAPHGFIVVCGPTGSGKTTTLYAALAERNTGSQNLCSVEDPVEIQIAGVAQIQVNARAGLTFASALRAFLRQDPNAVMIGEMRDSETAGVAISAALSGQLVLTTLHSNDAPRTIDRLLDLGLDRHAIASSLSAVVAQRLVRKVCAHCRLSGGGQRQTDVCSRCGGCGYRGRTGLFEVLLIDDALRHAIASGASSVSVAADARARGQRPICSDAAEKVRRGITSAEEVRRVLGSVELP